MDSGEPLQIQERIYLQRQETDTFNQTQLQESPHKLTDLVTRKQSDLKVDQEVDKSPARMQ